VLQLLQALMSRAPLAKAPRTDLGELLRAAFQVMPRRSLAFVVSDFISTPGWEKPLAQLGRRHEVVVVRLHDPAERELPELGLAMMQDAETGEQLFVDADDAVFRERYAAAIEAREAAMLDAFSDAGVDALELSTGDDLLETLVRFAALRRRRGVAATGLPHLSGAAPP
jgi:uncharacterized protein (DUF58 family)